MTVLSNAGSLTAARLAADLLGLLLFVVLSRYFGPPGIGQYAYGFAIAGVVYVAVHFGLEEYGMRESARISRPEVATLLGKLVGTQLLVAAAVIGGLFAFLSVSRPSGDVAAVVALLTAYQVLSALARTLFVPAFAEERMVVPALAELVCRAGAVLVSVALVVGFGFSLSGALTSYPLAAAALLVIAWRSAVRRVGSVKARFERSEISHILRLAWPFAAAYIVFQLYARADLIVLSLMRGEQAAGIYASAFKFLEVGIMPIVFLSTAVYPALSRTAHQDWNRFLVISDRFFRASLILGGVLTWGMIFVVPVVLVPLLGVEFAAARTVSMAMACLGVLLAVEVTGVRLLLAADLQVGRVKVQFGATLLNILLNVLLIPFLGVFGAVVASVIALAVMDVLYFREICRVVPRTPTLQPMREFLPAVVSSTAVAAMVAQFTSRLWIMALASLIVFTATLVTTRFTSVAGLFAERALLSPVE